MGEREIFFIYTIFPAIRFPFFFFALSVGSWVSRRCIDSHHFDFLLIYLFFWMWIVETFIFSSVSIIVLFCYYDICT